MKVLLMILVMMIFSSCASNSRTDSNGLNCLGKPCVKKSRN